MRNPGQGNCFIQYFLQNHIQVQFAEQPFCGFGQSLQQFVFFHQPGLHVGPFQHGSRQIAVLLQHFDIFLPDGMDFIQPMRSQDADKMLAVLQRHRNQAGQPVQPRFIDLVGIVVIVDDADRLTGPHDLADRAPIRRAGVEAVKIYRADHRRQPNGMICRIVQSDTAGRRFHEVQCIAQNGFQAWHGFFNRPRQQAGSRPILLFTQQHFIFLALPQFDLTAQFQVCLTQHLIHRADLLVHGRQGLVGGIHFGGTRFYQRLQLQPVLPQLRLGAGQRFNSLLVLGHVDADPGNMRFVLNHQFDRSQVYRKMGSVFTIKLCFGIRYPVLQRFFKSLANQFYIIAAKILQTVPLTDLRIRIAGDFDQLVIPAHGIACFVKQVDEAGYAVKHRVGQRFFPVVL